MKKEYILTFGIAFLVLAAVVVVSLMILMPQRVTVRAESISEYSAIRKSDYTFNQTNSVSFDSLEKTYTITDTQIQKFKSNNQYVAGNSDPFTLEETSASDTTNTTNNTNGSSNNSSSNNNSNSNSNSTSNSNNTVDKITNSNGGVANPPSTSK